MTSGALREVFFDGDGCCISQAAASMIVEKFDGRTVEDVKKFTANDMLELFGVRLTPNRQKCCLLPWRVLQSAIYSPVENGGADSPTRWEGLSLMSTLAETLPLDPLRLPLRFSHSQPRGPRRACR